ncbi:hypothetical protein ACLB2K_068705 [Fragaria x ananassa]
MADFSNIDISRAKVIIATSGNTPTSEDLQLLQIPNSTSARFEFDDLEPFALNFGKFCLTTLVHVVPTSSVNSNLPTSSDSVVLPNDEDEDFAKVVLKKAKTTTSTSSASSPDLQYYLDMPILEVPDGLEFNILGWWRSHEEVYPVLSLIARDLLSVPASTMASEAAFSAGGRVVSEKRASLS